MTEYVALGPHAWGSGPHEGKATRRMISNLPRRVVDDDDPLMIMVYRVEGDWEVDGMGRLTADEIVSEEQLKVAKDSVRKIDDLQGQLAREVEEALVEAEEVDDE